MSKLVLNDDYPKNIELLYDLLDSDKNPCYSVCNSKWAKYPAALS